MIALNDIYATIQGEGCQTGVPMVLVRLHGCDVGCPFCDTKETWVHDEEHLYPDLEAVLGTNPRWAWLEARVIVDYVKDHWPRVPWVLLTGGEPGDQEVGPLIEGFNDAGYKVSMETSGTATKFLDGTLPDWLTVSPKIGMPGGRVVSPLVVGLADEVKHVVGKPEHVDQLDALLAACEVRGVVCLQPMSESKKATAVCTEVCLDRGWRLSVQVHKVIDVR